MFLTVDVYDMVKYDCLHNYHVPVPEIQSLYYVTRDFADCVVPQEFGIHQKDKRILGSNVCAALLEKIRTDLTKQDTIYKLDHRYVWGLFYEMILILHLKNAKLKLYSLCFVIVMRTTLGSIH